MSAFHKMIATVKSALEGAPNGVASHAAAPHVVPVHPAAPSPVVPIARNARFSAYAACG